MAKYRKKSVIVEAIKWDGNAGTANSFIGESYGEDWEYRADDKIGGADSIWVQTKHGLLSCKIGDWLVKDINGEVLPYKPDIFETTHEVVE